MTKGMYSSTQKGILVFESYDGTNFSPMVYVDNGLVQIKKLQSIKTLKKADVLKMAAKIRAVFEQLNRIVITDTLITDYSKANAKPQKLSKAC
jgi:hypothetical protein